MANHDDKADNDFKFYYVVSNEDKDVVTGETETVKQVDGDGTNDGVVTGPDQYYVFLIASQDITRPAKTRIIDSRAFYVSTGQKGDVPVSYTAKVDNKLYTGDKYPDNVSVEVTVKYRNGAEAKVAASGLSLDGGFKSAGNTISKGSLKGDGSTTVYVYLDKVEGTEGEKDETDGKYYFYNDGHVATCTLTYSDDDPVGTSIDFKRNVQNDPVTHTNYGTSWSEDETEKVWDLKKNQDSEITVKDGGLTMTNGNVAGDTYTVTVKDQYGTPMGDAKYYINGAQVPTTQTTIKADDAAAKVLEIKAQSKGSEVSQTWRVNVPKETEVTAVDTTVQKAPDIVPTSDEALANAIASATDRRIVVGQDLTLDVDKNVTLNADLLVKSGAALTLKDSDNTGANNLTVAHGKTLTFEDGSFLVAVDDLTLKGQGAAEKNVIFKDMRITAAAGKTLTIQYAKGGHVTIKNATGGIVDISDSEVSKDTLVVESGKLILGSGMTGETATAPLHVENKTKDAKNLVVKDATTLKNIVSTSDTAEAAGPIQVGDGTNALALTSTVLPKIASGADLTMAANATLTDVPAESGVTVNGVEFTTSASDMTVKTTGTTAGDVTAKSTSSTVKAVEESTGKTVTSTTGDATGKVTESTTTSITTAAQLSKNLQDKTTTTLTLGADITGFSGGFGLDENKTIDLAGYSVSGTGAIAVDQGKTLTINNSGTAATFGVPVEVWNTGKDFKFDDSSSALVDSKVVTASNVTLSSLENVVALSFLSSATTVSAVANVAGVEGAVSKYIVTAYRPSMSALEAVSATTSEGKVVITYDKTKTATVSVPASYGKAFTVGSASVRAGHDAKDFSAISWVISK